MSMLIRAAADGSQAAGEEQMISTGAGSHEEGSERRHLAITPPGKGPSESHTVPLRFRKLSIMTDEVMDSKQDVLGFLKGYLLMSLGLLVAGMPAMLYLLLFTFRPLKGRHPEIVVAPDVVVGSLAHALSILYPFIVVRTAFGKRDGWCFRLVAVCCVLWAIGQLLTFWILPVGAGPVYGQVFMLAAQLVCTYYFKRWMSCGWTTALSLCLLPMVAPFLCGVITFNTTFAFWNDTSDFGKLALRLFLHPLIYICASLLVSIQSRKWIHCNPQGRSAVGALLLAGKLYIGRLLSSSFEGVGTVALSALLTAGMEVLMTALNMRIRLWFEKRKAAKQTAPDQCADGAPSEDPAKPHNSKKAKNLKYIQFKLMERALENSIIISVGCLLVVNKSLNPDLPMDRSTLILGSFIQLFVELISDAICFYIEIKKFRMNVVNVFWWCWPELFVPTFCALGAISLSFGPSYVIFLNPNERTIYVPYDWYPSWLVSSAFHYKPI